MKLYLDEDISAAVLVQVLHKAGHDVQTAADVGLLGREDPLHLIQAIDTNRSLLSRNYQDLEHLHLLIMHAKGHHPGVLVVRRDNDPRRNPSPHDIVRALRNLTAANVPIADEYIILNHWQ